MPTWCRVLHVNLTAAFALTQVLLPALRASADASIIFTSSGVGRRGRAYWGAYAVSKFGVEALSAGAGGGARGHHRTCASTRSIPARRAPRMRRAGLSGRGSATRCRCREAITARLLCAARAGEPRRHRAELRCSAGSWQRGASAPRAPPEFELAELAARERALAAPACPSACAARGSPAHAWRSKSWRTSLAARAAARAVDTSDCCPPRRAARSAAPRSARAAVEHALADRLLLRLAELAAHAHAEFDSPARAPRAAGARPAHRRRSAAPGRRRPRGIGLTLMKRRPARRGSRSSSPGPRGIGRRLAAAPAGLAAAARPGSGDTETPARAAVRSAGAHQSAVEPQLIAARGTRMPSSAAAPLTVRRPARIQASASRREARPSCGEHLLQALAAGRASAAGCHALRRRLGGAATARRAQRPRCAISRPAALDRRPVRRRAVALADSSSSSAPSSSASRHPRRSAAPSAARPRRRRSASCGLSSAERAQLARAAAARRGSAGRSSRGTRAWCRAAPGRPGTSR